MEQETWKPVVGYEDFYEVSNFGRVKSLNYNKTGKEEVRKLGSDWLGYLQVSLHYNGEKKQPYVHDLVWEAFNGKIPDGKEIDHIDGNPSNNCLENLRCVSHKENMNNPITKQRVVEANRLKAQDPEWQKKTSEAVRKRCCKPVTSYKDGEEKLYQSAAEASRITGVGFSHISRCCRGKRKSAGGFIWRFAD